jgi:catechol 2,3-dioxygenase-like lactoylglutathione lyase family enzyme
MPNFSMREIRAPGRVRALHTSPTPRPPLGRRHGQHVAVRVPDLDAARRLCVETLDFGVIHEWPSGDLQLAHIASPGDHAFWIEPLGGGTPSLGRLAFFADLWGARPSWPRRSAERHVQRFRRARR